MAYITLSDLAQIALKPEPRAAISASRPGPGVELVSGLAAGAFLAARSVATTPGDTLRAGVHGALGFFVGSLLPRFVSGLWPDAQIGDLSARRRTRARTRDEINQAGYEASRLHNESYVDISHAPEAARLAMEIRRQAAADRKAGGDQSEFDRNTRAAATRRTRKTARLELERQTAARAPDHTRAVELRASTRANAGVNATPSMIRADTQSPAVSTSTIRTNTQSPAVNLSTIRADRQARFDRDMPSPSSRQQASMLGKPAPRPASRGGGRR